MGAEAEVIVTLRDPKTRRVALILGLFAIFALLGGASDWTGDGSYTKRVHCVRTTAGANATCELVSTSPVGAPRREALAGQRATWAHWVTDNVDSKGNHSQSHYGSVTPEGGTDRRVFKQVWQGMGDWTDEATRFTSGRDAGERDWLLQEQRNGTLVMAILGLAVLGFALYWGVSARARIIVDPRARQVRCEQVGIFGKRTAAMALPPKANLRFGWGAFGNAPATTVYVDGESDAKAPLFLLRGFAQRYVASRSRPLRKAMLEL